MTREAVIHIFYAALKFVQNCIIFKHANLRMHRPWVGRILVNYRGQIVDNDHRTASFLWIISTREQRDHHHWHCKNISTFTVTRSQLNTTISNSSHSKVILNFYTLEVRRRFGIWTHPILKYNIVIIHQSMIMKTTYNPLMIREQNWKISPGNYGQTIHALCSVSAPMITVMKWWYKYVWNGTRI